MSTESNDTLWLTHASFDRLQAELERLQAAPSDHAGNDARIIEVKNILRRAEVSNKPDDGLVEPGMVISVLFAGDDEPTSFLLAQRDLASGQDDLDLDVYSPSTPLGLSIVGKYPGDSFAYTTASGKNVSGGILTAVPFGG
ncbi:transcription elongation factor GreA [Salinibacterium sp. G-O1]|uniref:GreA/GreB family elongation factor n=1 Tax=Salinibacterium sp. G-O1 TaxID=3046208 RepID=UPI0024B971AA|nr:transcription elongation factor GreA [Salinibacterium sp. G-O1]MDJ0334099.1 transcription elongation factor GreA [Salinibacterium sp. G-O1]